MFKSKLQEYCHSKSWLLPEYEVTREGPDHCPRFKGVVSVNGTSFAYPDSCKSIKEAHNFAAKFAFEHLAGCSDLSNSVSGTPASSIVQLPEAQVTSSALSPNGASALSPNGASALSPNGASALSPNGANRVTEDNNMLKDKGHMYKSQLQVYAQKRNLQLPVYSVERVGPPHACLFRSKVTLEGKTYGNEEFFYTLKEAESAAAKLALASIVPEGTQEDDPSIYKNLLQEFFQKEFSCLPQYTTAEVGPPHNRIFVSSLEIQGETFKGQEAKIKKQAEMNVAKVAYMTLKERKFKRVDNLHEVGSTTQVMETPQRPSAYTSAIKIDAQSVPDKQIKCEGKGLEVTSSLHTNTQPLGGSNMNQKKKKMKKKIMVLPVPQNPSSSPNDMKSGSHNPKDLNIEKGPNASLRTLHSDEKWIAVTEDPY